jgi:hypothetical protein
MDTNIKPGWKTTEFWLTLGTFCVTGFVLTGMLAPERQDTLISIVSHSIESIAMVAGQTVMLCRYINSRKEVKKKQIETKAAASKKTEDITPLPAALPPKSKPKRRRRKNGPPTV